MAQRPSAFLAFRSIGTAAALWLVIGVPVAAVIAAFRASVWVITVVPAMAATACLLGAVHGLWFYLAGQGPKSNYNGFLLLGSVSGGFLGVLAFPPVFSSTNIIATRPTAAFFLMAAMVGGIAAGVIAAHVLYLPLQAQVSTTSRRVVVSGLILIVLAAIDYRFCWPATTERIAAPEVSRQDITGLSAGSARGSQWSGCYEFRGKTPLGQGGAFGLLKVVQTDGLLKVEDGRESLMGGVDRDGRFRFGAEITEHTDTLRILWNGKFHDSSFDFSKRLTVVNGVNSLGINPLTGTAQLFPCDQ
jgi:hypothetical protein